MYEDYIEGIVKGEVGDDRIFVPFAIMNPNQDLPRLVKAHGNEVMLIGKTKRGQSRFFRHEYTDRRVLLDPKTVYEPNPRYGEIGSRDFIFPDEHTDVSKFVPSLEEVLKDAHPRVFRNVIDTEYENKFFYGLGKHDIFNDGSVYFLTFVSYTKGENSPSSPFSPLGKMLKTGIKGFEQSTNYLYHYTKRFRIAYAKSVLKDPALASEFIELANANKDLAIMDDNLGRAFSESKYMPSLCRQITRIMRHRL